MRADRIIAGTGLAGLTLLFAWWINGKEVLTFAGTAMAIVSLVLFAWLGLELTPRLTRFLKGEEELQLPEPGKRSQRRFFRHPWTKIALMILAWQAAVYIIAYFLDLKMHGFDGALPDKLYDIWVKGDAPHYFDLAESWYVKDGDPRYFIVFYPLFPLAIKAGWYIVRDFFSSAILVSTVCAVISGIFLYELSLLDHERKDALRTVKFQYLLPAAFFFAAPMSESLFFMLSVACMYFSRRKRFFISCLFGALAAFTRSLGILLLVPVAMEMIRELAELRKAKAKIYGQISADVLCLLLLSTGTLAYFYINYAVWGTPWQFVAFQREHWSQGLGLFFSTASYQTENIINTTWDPPQFWGLWLPNVVYMLFGLAVMIPAAKKLRASYTAYFLVYFFVSMGATWLLSAPRYLTFCFPLAFAMTALTKSKRADVLATVLCTAGFLIYLTAHVAGWHVY
jgi:hypothetical protein